MDFRCQVKRKMGKGFLFGERCKGSNKNHSVCAHNQFISGCVPAH